MDEHRFHAQSVCHKACMLTAGPAEAVKQVFGNVVPALDRYFLDRVGHVLDRDGDETFRHAFSAPAIADLCGQSSESSRNHGVVERLILSWSEDSGKEIWLQLAEHHIRVG